LDKKTHVIGAIYTFVVAIIFVEPFNAYNENCLVVAGSILSFKKKSAELYIFYFIEYILLLFFLIVAIYCVYEGNNR